MIYIYMFCLGLSSLFAYKPSYAETYVLRHGFFIPQNAFEQNIRVPERQIIKKTVSTQGNVDSRSAAELKAEAPAPVERQADRKNLGLESKKVSEKSVEKTIKDSERKDVSAAQSKIKQSASLPHQQISQTNGVVKETPVRKNINAPQLSERNLKELLAALPYPDFKQPKFKQLYALYALDLRTLYRDGKFLANPEQEAALAKANSIRRFEVK